MSGVTARRATEERLHRREAELNKAMRLAAVGEMAERLAISASLVSHHLRLLRAARLLQAERRGRQVFYMVGDEHIRSMLSDMVDHVAEGDAEE